MYRDINIQPLEQLVFDTTATICFKIQARHLAELEWIKKLHTTHPLGLNIYRVGNISNAHNIDISNSLSIRKRKRRSHARRWNRNIKRRCRAFVYVADLYKIFRHAGRRALLSKLSSLSLTDLSILDTECDSIFSNSHMYDTALIIISYTNQFLRPHIDLTSSHYRYFLKNPLHQ